jgi:hypothetical protein
MEAMALSVALATKGTVRRGAGVHLDQVDLAVLDRELHVHQAHDVQRAGQRLGLADDLVDGCRWAV